MDNWTDKDRELNTALAMFVADCEGAPRSKASETLFRVKILNETFGGTGAKAIDGAWLHIRTSPHRSQIEAMAANIRKTRPRMGWMLSTAIDGSKYLLHLSDRICVSMRVSKDKSAYRESIAVPGGRYLTDFFWMIRPTNAAAEKDILQKAPDMLLELERLTENPDE